MFLRLHSKKWRITYISRFLPTCTQCFLHKISCLTANKNMTIFFWSGNFLAEFLGFYSRQSPPPKKKKLYPRDLNFFPNFDKDLFVELRHKAYNFWGKFLLLNFANKSLPKFQKKFTDKVLFKNYTPYISISFQILVKIYL
jgi:hypothetical protein